MEYNAILTPVYDWDISIQDHFDLEDKTELSSLDKTFNEMEEFVETLRKRYPRCYVNANARVLSNDVTFIATDPLEMEQDERNDMEFAEWHVKWYPWDYK